ncbi:saccharopine dehydrogenase NADP-binding domain-containing protein [Haloimpatiens sp. FM7330]|uniref:saccharopine dehydrogenase NADP-binding domain-containing protein n=1 Tax=Haloimpatiens sp. FM7330 TaxID=3298610 RepID=UPI0036397625
MQVKRIGIIGATGNIGKTLITEIIDNTNLSLIIGCRDISKVDKYFKANNRVNVMKLNINDNNELLRFCNQCQIIINCSSPSSLFYNKVVLVCLEKNIDYIDVSGNMELFDYLNDQREVIEHKKLSYILSAGIYPGFTEIYPYYISNMFDVKINNLTVYFSSIGEISTNAAYDFVSSFNHNHAQGMSYYKEGDIKKIDSSKSTNIDSPSDILLSEMYPIINHEFADMIDKNKSIGEAYFFNAYPNKSVFNEFMVIKIMGMYKKHKEKLESAKSLQNKYYSMFKEYGNHTKLYVNIKGEKDNKKALIKSSFEFNGSSNCISAIVAYSAMNAILNKKEYLGLTFPYFVIDIEDCLNKLQEKGAKMNTSIEYI